MRDTPTQPAPHKNNFARNVGVAIGAAILVLGGGATILTSWSPAADAHASRKHDDRSPDEKLDQLVTDIGEVKTNQHELSRTLDGATRDIAVIKRQLGLDGLGPPAAQVRSSRVGGQ